MLKHLLCIPLLSFTLGTFAQIPANRIMDWTHVGMLQSIPNFTTTVDMSNYGAVANDTSVDNGAILQTVLNNVAGTGTVIYFPPGTYTFKTPVNIPNTGKVIIRGNLSSTTLFHFTTATTNTGNFQIWGYEDWGPGDVVAGATKNSTTLTLFDATGLNVGDWVDISQENDSALMATQNPPNAMAVAPRTVGQVMKITAINGNTLTLDRPLHYTYNMNLMVQVKRFQMVEQVGFENFTIENLVAGDKSNFGFVYCANVWIKCVRSIKSVSCHVNLAMCGNCMVRDSYFHDNWNFGNGGHGYGVAITTHSTDNLVENNIFDKNRHAMLVQRGANGNVFGYNYSINATGDGTISIFNRITDVSLHGHFCYMNLWEGNVCQEITTGDTWGPAGFGNTFFRNRLTREGIRIMDASIEQNIVGNDMRKDNTAPFTLNDITIDSGISILIHGNQVNGVVDWDSTLGTNNLIQSYYLSSAPGFFYGAPWPPLGPEYPTGTIPAELHQGQGYFTQCEYEATMGMNSIGASKAVRAFPNPAGTEVTIETGYDAKELLVYDHTGKLVQTTPANKSALYTTLNIQGLAPGVYSVVVQSTAGVYAVKVIKL